MILKEILNTDYAQYGRQSMVMPRIASFNGTDDYIDTGLDLTGATSVDLTMVCYRGSVGISTASMQAKNSSNTFGILWHTTNHIYVMAKNGATTHYGYINNQTQTGWFTLRAVYDGGGAGDADRLKLYKNGVLQTLSFGGTIPASLGTYDTRKFRIGYGYYTSDGFMTGLISYLSISINGGTSYEYYPIGMGDYDYDVSGQNQHGIWAGTGDRYAYNQEAQTRMIKEGYSLWQKTGSDDIHVPFNNAGSVLSLTPGVNIPAGYSKTEDILGNDTYYNFANALFDFDPDNTDNNKLDVFDKSNSTIHIATGSMEYYDASIPHGWLGRELYDYTLYNNYFNAAFQDRLFTKVEDYLLKDILNCKAKQTGIALTRAKTYCGIP